MNFQPISGVIVPTVTPFDDSGAVNLEMISPLVQFLIHHGVKGLFPLGTTGEGTLLTIEERKQVASAMVEAVAGTVPVIIHTGAITTRDALDLTIHARDIGASAAAIVAPYYFTHTDEALEQHFSTIAKAVPDFPIYLYNFPGVSNNTLSRDLVLRLVINHDNIVGLKDSSGDLQTLFASNHLHDGQFNTAVGPDELIVASLAMGIDASVSGHANLVPEVVVGIYDAVQAGNLEEAQRHQRKLNKISTVLASAGWLPVVKGLMAHRGLTVGSPRLPLLPASDEQVKIALNQLSALGVTLDPM